MLKRTMVLFALLFGFSCFAAQSSSAEKYKIMKDDNIENSDVLAIPLDDSEIEDEEEINFSQKREEFQLPQSK